MPEPIGQLSIVMLNVDDMDKACAFYANTMGLKLKFRDGARWAAFDAGGVTLALAAGSERASTPVALNFKVANVEEALARVTADGGRREGQTVTSAHEVRAAVRDHDGHVINLYSPVPKSR
jgi:catechol 2,3-dioxygenase-like lactoylglutathione lyase family enzyme